jgi:hypothetical protein
MFFVSFVARPSWLKDYHEADYVGFTKRTRIR